jgi:hypothetical protein
MDFPTRDLRKYSGLPFLACTLRKLERFKRPWARTIQLVRHRAGSVSLKIPRHVLQKRTSKF